MVLSCPFCKVRVGRGQRICDRCDQLMVRICPSCAEEVSVLAETCKYCGNELRPEPAAYKPATLRVRKPEIEIIEEKPEIEFLDDEVSCAWEEKGKGVFRAWWGTCRKANTDPGGFYSNMPSGGGKLAAVNYAFTWAAQLLLLLQFAALGMIGWSLVEWQELPAWATDYVRWTAIASTAGLPVIWLAVAVSLFVKAGLYHVLLKVLGAKGTYSDTFRILAYGTSAQAWALLPVLGLLMVPPAQAIQHYHGFRERHGLSSGRAVFAAILPWLLAAGALAAYFGCIAPAAWLCGHCG